jgi:hypothetical protein
VQAHDLLALPVAFDVLDDTLRVLRARGGGVSVAGRARSDEDRERQGSHHRGHEDAAQVGVP